LKDVISIILGGGRGQRLYPLTLQRSKPSVAFAGKYRLIDIPISNCINSGIKKIFVLTQFLSVSMHRHIMQTYAFDAFTDGFVDILAAEQTPDRADWFQGTSDAVRATLHHTMYYKTSQALILGGDHLYRMDYAQMVRFHREMGADITLAVYPVTRDDAPRMGLLRANAMAEVTEFVEKPQDPDVIDRFRAPRELFAARGMIADSDTYLGSMGIYCFEPHVLRDLLQDETKTDFGREIIPEAIGKLKVLAYPFSGYWRDIGTIASFFEANLDLVDKNPPLNLHQGAWPFYTRARALPPARIIESTIENSLVVEGSTITGARIEHSIVGIRARIRKGAFLKDVIHMGADFYEGEHVLFDGHAVGPDQPAMGVGRNCRIERCIIDKNVCIGDGVIIRAQPEVKEHRDQYRWIRDGVTVIPKGTVIPDGTIL
jgi:glucose-1-phosphate adenylyltransferase